MYFYVRILKLNNPSYSRKTTEYGNFPDTEMRELKEKEKLFGKRRQKK